MLRLSSLRALFAILNNSRASTSMPGSVYDSWIYEIGKANIEGSNDVIHTGLLQIFASFVPIFERGSSEHKSVHEHHDSSRGLVMRSLTCLAVNSEMSAFLVAAGAADMTCKLLKACVTTPIAGRGQNHHVVADESSNLLHSLLRNLTSINDKAALVGNGVCDVLLEALAESSASSVNTQYFCLLSLANLLDSVKSAVEIVDSGKNTWSVIATNIELSNCSPSEQAKGIQKIVARVAFLLAQNGKFDSLMHEANGDRVGDVVVLPVVESLTRAINAASCDVEMQFFAYAAVVMLAKEFKIVRSKLALKWLEDVMENNEKMQSNHPLRAMVDFVKNLKSSEEDVSEPLKPQWDYFLSHVQAETAIYALDLWSSLRAAESEVWLDVKMDKRDEDAMRHGVENSKAIVVILSESYFNRPVCLKELVWACELGKPIIPCVPSDLKKRIGEFGGQRPGDNTAPCVVPAPEFLRGMLSINFETLDRSDHEFWEVSVRKIRKAERKTIPLQLAEGVTLQEAAAAAQSELQARIIAQAAG